MGGYTCPLEGCDATTATERGMKSHVAQVHPESLPWSDREWLREQYVKQEKSCQEISDEVGCSLTTIHRALNEHGIKTREHGQHARKPGLNLRMNAYGYMVWHGTRGEDGEQIDYTFSVHRLLAIAEYGADAVCSDMDVHHKNGIPWDNRPGNIELKDRAEHAKYHMRERGGEA